MSHATDCALNKTIIVYDLYVLQRACRLIYTAAFGGVVSMLPEMFRRVNGYSLQYFGWGGEDDDMGHR